MKEDRAYSVIQNEVTNLIHLPFFSISILIEITIIGLGQLQSEIVGANKSV